jgi:hypothetical protein
LELYNSSIGVSYTRELFKSRLILQLPVSFGYGTPGITPIGSTLGFSNLTVSRKVMDLGFGAYFNATRGGPVTYFIGPLFRFLEYTGTGPTYSPYYYNNNYPTNQTFDAYLSVMMVNNGLMFRFTPRFNMMINLAFGQVVYHNSALNLFSASNYLNPIVQAGFSVGYRFGK